MEAASDHPHLHLHLHLNPSMATHSLFCVSVSQAEAISDGDLIDRKIRGQQDFSLMPVHAMVSSVAPGILLDGGLGARPDFPSYVRQLFVSLFLDTAMI